MIDLSPIYDMVLLGQKITVNQITNTVIIEIHEKFNLAGKVLGWPGKFSINGFGINPEIISHIIQNKSLLCVIYLGDKPESKHWLNFDLIQSFIKENNSLHDLENISLYTLPVSLFSERPPLR